MSNILFVFKLYPHNLFAAVCVAFILSGAIAFRMLLPKISSTVTYYVFFCTLLAMLNVIYLKEIIVRMSDSGLYPTRLKCSTLDEQISRLIQQSPWWSPLIFCSFLRQEMPGRKFILSRPNQLAWMILAIGKASSVVIKPQPALSPEKLAKLQLLPQKTFGDNIFIEVSNVTLSGLYYSVVAGNKTIWIPEQIYIRLKET